MMKTILTWLQNTFAPQEPRPRQNRRESDNHLRKTIKDGKIAASKPKQDAKIAAPKPGPKPKPKRNRNLAASKPNRDRDQGQPEYVDMNPGEMDSITKGRVKNNGPGKNVYVRSKFVREDTGTHETLKIIDSSLTDTDDDDEAGLDPYNSGQFDRSKSWDSRFRK